MGYCSWPHSWEPARLTSTLNTFTAASNPANHLIL